MSKPFSVKFSLTLAAVLFLPCAFLSAAEVEGIEPSVSVPPLNFQHETLPNGLEFYSVADHSSPTVAVQVWYRVGSKDDPAQRSGFAHLFEHMMFKGNEHLTPDAFENLTENVGGENNAFTAADMTVYHEVVPSNYLNPILWAEAERMSSLAVTEKNFTSERDVVKEEYRQRILANPFGEFFLDSIRNSYAVHPYKRPGIGSIEDLEASKLPEVRAFHSTFYRPDNATLVVVGDFQPDELRAWVKKYFGAIKKPSEKIPRVTVQEPPRKENKQIVKYSPKVPLPAVAVTYLGPSIRSDDAPALALAAEILSGGESSRLYQSLVYEQQIAQQVSFSPDLHEDIGLLTVQLILASGKEPADAEKGLSAQLDKILKEGVTPEELAKAKNRFLTGQLIQRETNNGKASDLGEAAVLYGDPDRVNTDLAKLQAVTAVQIKEVLNRYLSGQKKVVLEYLPVSMKPAARQAKKERSREEPGDGIARSDLSSPAPKTFGRGTPLLQFALSFSETTRIATARFESPASSAARPALRLSVLRRIGMTSLVVGMCLTSTHSAFAIAGVDTPPPPSAWHEIKFVTPKETRLENGLRVIVAERPGLPLLSAEILIGQGAVADPPGLGGTATMTGELLTKGTESMSAPRIAEAIESLGGTIGSGAGRETSAAYLQVMSVKADPALRILADVVLRPAFKQEEIDRLRNQRLDYLRVVLQQPGSLARFVTERVVFGAAPYGHALNGTLESLPAIGREEIVKFYRSHYLPREAAFVLAGDVTLGQGRDFAEKLFGAWKNEKPGPDDIGHSAKADWKPRDVVG